MDAATLNSTLTEVSPFVSSEVAVGKRKDKQEKVRQSGILRGDRLIVQAQHTFVRRQQCFQYFGGFLSFGGK